jgi:hypothetical protein
MTKTLIVYEDGKPDLERSAMLIASELSAGTHAVQLRAASAVSIPEILAARLFFIGAESAEKPSFAEMSRVLTGINLAGRTAAFFGPSKAAVAALRAMTADSDIKAPGPDLVNPRPEPELVSAWLHSVL